MQTKEWGMIKAEQPYFPLVSGGFYRLIGEGIDYKLVKCKGNLFYVPVWVFDREGN